MEITKKFILMTLSNIGFVNLSYAVFNFSLYLLNEVDSLNILKF
jgi:hypothetical protein